MDCNNPLKHKERVSKNEFIVGYNRYSRLMPQKMVALKQICINALLARYIPIYMIIYIMICMM